MLFAVTYRRRWRREELVVARTVLNGSDEFRASAKPLPNRLANPRDVKMCHGVAKWDLWWSKGRGRWWRLLMLRQPNDVERQGGDLIYPKCRNFQT